MIAAVVLLADAAGGAVVAVHLLVGPEKSEALEGDHSGEADRSGDGVPADDTYHPVWGLCRDIDFTPVFDVLPYTGTPFDDEQLLPGHTLLTRCSFYLDFPSRMASLSVVVGTTLAHEFAVRTHQTGLESIQEVRQELGRDVTFVDLLEGVSGNPEAADLPWHYATLIVISGPDVGTTVAVHVVEDNMTVEMSTSTTATMAEIAE